jgi:hypothetical protein
MAAKPDEAVTYHNRRCSTSRKTRLARTVDALREIL